MSVELAVAVFAAETGLHLVSPPQTERFRRFGARFDGPAYTAELQRRSLRFVGRSAPGFPSALAAVFDPPVGLFVRGARVEITTKKAPSKK